MTATRWNAALSLAFVGAFSFATAGFSGQEDPIRGPIEGNEVVVLHGSIRPEARPENDRGALDPATPIHDVELVLGLTDPQAAQLEALLEAQRDPSSTDYRNWLSPEEYGERFGTSENELARVTSWLEAQGFAVEQVARARNWMKFSGSAGQIAATFHTELHHYEVEGEKHFANATAPSIPASLAGVIAVIRGLDDFRPKPFRPKPGRGTMGIHPDLNAANGNHYLAPADLATIYDIQVLYEATWDGTGQKLVIAGQTDIDIADIRAFRTEFNLPARDPQLVLAGTDPGVSPDDQIEADLDLEWSGAVARNATIVYVYSQNIFESVEYAIDQNLAPVISVSYGGCETGSSTSYRAMAQQANAQGITWVNASGDSGAAGCDVGEKIATQGPAVTFPADIPEVTAVGGTELNEAGGSYWSSPGSALSYIPEKAWNDTALGDGLAASGGGASAIYAKPWWQTGPGVPNDQARDVPDVSLTASGAHDAYVIYAKGNLTAVGGTSASAPSFAGIVAILNQYLVARGELANPGLGNLNPPLYSLAQSAAGAFHDVTTGNNIVPCAAGVTGCVAGSYGYQAGPGYDLATGLGSVDGWNLVTKWASLPPAVGTKLLVSASLGIILQSASTQLTATVSAVTGSSTPAGTVVFALGNTTLGSATLKGSGATATASLVVKGSTLAFGSNTIAASYTGSANFSASTASVVLTVTAPAVATSITVTANPASIPQSGTTILTATVKPASGSGSPAGTVAFAAGNTQLGAATLTTSAAGATATLTIKGASLTIGTNAIVASYSGTSGFSRSTSAPLTVIETVPQVATITGLTANPATISQSASTSLAVTVRSASGTAVPTGLVTFTSASTLLGTANLSNSNAMATATITVKGSSLAIGNNAITAVYSGSAGSTGSTGAATVTVTAPPTATALTVAATPTSIAPGGSTVLTATVKALSGNTGPTGSVTFAIPGAILGSARLTVSGGSGTATLTVKGSSLAVGANRITATCITTGNFTGAASSVAVNVVPQPIGTTLAVAANPASVIETASTKLTATVRAATGSSSPTGSVTFATGKTTLGSVALTGSGGTAAGTLTVKGSSLAPGSNVINVIYAGVGFSGATASATVNVTAPTAASK